MPTSSGAASGSGAEKVSIELSRVNIPKRREVMRRKASVIVVAPKKVVKTGNSIEN